MVHLSPPAARDFHLARARVFPNVFGEVFRDVLPDLFEVLGVNLALEVILPLFVAQPHAHQRIPLLREPTVNAIPLRFILEAVDHQVIVKSSALLEFTLPEEGDIREQLGGRESVREAFERFVNFGRGDRFEIPRKRQRERIDDLITPHRCQLAHEVVAGLWRKRGDLSALASPIGPLLLGEGIVIRNSRKGGQVSILPDFDRARGGFGTEIGCSRSIASGFMHY